MRARRRAMSSFFLFPFFLLPWLGGCKSTELVEAELRTLEKDIRELKHELFRSEAHNDALQRELQAVRTPGPSSAKLTPEAASQSTTLRQVVLGRGTSGYDGDDIPGDEAVQLMVEPRDEDGHTIKAPGSLFVQALEITPEGLKAPLDTWEVPAEQLRKKWHGGLFTHGYQVILPWRTWPSSDKLRVVARFTLADGRTFEAERDITIRPTPVARRRALPPPGDIQLPLPRTVEPPATLEKPVTNATPPVESIGMWQAKKPVPLNEAIELLKPVPLPPQSWER